MAFTVEETPARRGYPSLAQELISSLRDLIFLVMQFQTGFDYYAVVDLAFEIFQAVVFLVVEKVGDVGVQTHHYIFATFDLRLLALDRAQNVVGNRRRGFDAPAPVAMRARPEQMVFQTFPRALARHFHQSESRF